MFREIQPKVFVKCFLNLETSNDNSNPRLGNCNARKGCPGFLRHVMAIDSIFLLV